MWKLFFTVWSGLKSLIWKESITDRNVAIFELVKNSIDARSKNIIVRFQWYKQDDWSNQITSIEIFDDGKWMGLDDIKNKWLKVAYSAKKEWTEDAGNVWYYAWAKWVWRFACDTLWEELDLYSTRKSDTYTEHLQVNWRDFEHDLNAWFQEIPIQHEQVSKNFDYWVRILITKIRETWSRDDLKKLKRWLSKLLQPKMEWDTTEGVRIFLEASFEKDIPDAQGNLKTYYESINWEIKNLVFSELDKKTIQIKAFIDEGWEYLQVILLDKGEEIYRFKQTNEYSLLRWISIQLSFLDKWAKATFNRITWIHSKDYGNIFVYKNGFRILPYGNSWDDSFGIDLRKAQWYSRFLGNREIMGQVIINGENGGFFETTNRDSGFIKNSTFHQFQSFLIDTVLSRFEKYIRAVKWYGLDEIIEDDEEEMGGHIEKVNEDIAKVIASIWKIKWLVEFSYSDSINDLLSRSENHEALIEKIEKAVQSSGNLASKDALNKITWAFKELNEKDRRAKKIIKTQTKQLDEFESELSSTKKKNEFLLAVSRNSIEISELAHHLKNYSSGLRIRLSAVSKGISGDKINKESLLKNISECFALTSRIDKFVQFASIANFDLQSSENKWNVIEYIQEYISDTLTSLSSDFEWVRVSYTGISEFETVFTPIDIAIILDNLFSNANKAAFKKSRVTEKRIDISFGLNKNQDLEITFCNYWSVIPEELRKRIFEMGFTTTPGWSGLWLHIVKEIIQKNWGDILCKSSLEENSTSFIFTIKKI